MIPEGNPFLCCLYTYIQCVCVYIYIYIYTYTYTYTYTYKRYTHVCVYIYMYTYIYIYIEREREMCMYIYIYMILETLRDVHEGGRVEERPKRLQVILLHVGQPEVAVAPNLPEGPALPGRRAQLAAQQGHQGGLAASVAPADRHAGAEGELHAAVLDEVLLVLSEG